MIDWNREVARYWTAEARQEMWPEDQEEHVFLLRAVDPVGEAIFGSEWKGTEPSEYPDIGLRERIGPGIYARMKQANADYDQKWQVYFLLRDEGGYRDGELPSLHDSPLVFTDEQWEVALDLAEKVDQRRQAGRKRLDRVCKAIKKAVLDGVIKTALRDIPGGALSRPLPAAQYWATETGLAPRFKLGQINDQDQFGPDLRSPYRSLMEQARAGRPGRWRYVYIEAAGVDRLLGKLGVPDNALQAAIDPMSHGQPEAHVESQPASKKARRPRTAAKSLSIQEYAKAKWPDGIRNIPRTHRIKQINDHLASIGIKEGASPPTIDKALLALYGADKV